MSRVVAAPSLSMRLVTGLAGQELFQFAAGETPAVAPPVTVPKRS